MPLLIQSILVCDQYRYRPLDPDKLPLSSEMGTSDHLQWESVKERHIKAGTLDKLVECLIGPDCVMDSRHFNVFFATYRAFAKPVEVMERLQRRFAALEEGSSPSTQALVMQNSIRSIIVCWLDMYPADFYTAEDDFSFLAKLVEFAAKYRLVDLRSQAVKVKQHFRGVKADGGLIARVACLDQLATAFGYENPDLVENASERAKHFDVSRDNCVQIAEQLTYWDATLFKEVIIHQCQSCVWSKRHKISPEKYYTVKATIDQFNAVVSRVHTSVVLPDCKIDFRAKIIVKWIDIARELRALKNFSSLKAVLTGLQSEPVHRLKSVWALVSSRSMATFRELSAIFDGDDSGDEKRILDQEGTAKSSPLRRPQLIQNCRRTKSDVNLAECQGTVPYLGSFLTDLTMIDNATPDNNDEGLINFEKREREFEVLAKLRLLQGAARGYKMPRDRAFCAWFHYLPTMDDKQCYDRSCEVEKPSSTPQPSMSKSQTISRLFPLSRGAGGESPTTGRTLMGQSSRDSGIHSDECTDNGSNGRGMSHSLTAPSTPVNSVSWKGGRSTFYHSGRQVPSKATDFSNISVLAHQRTQSGDSSLSVSTPTAQPSPFSQSLNMAMTSSASRNGEASTSGGSGNSSPRGSLPPSLPPPAPSQFHLARVGLDDSLQTAGAGANYKCIKIENGDRMNSLISRCLEKHLMGEYDPSSFCLVQLLPDGGEFQLPTSCNPFYALAKDSSSPMLNVLLRRRPEGETSVAPSARKINKMKMTNLMRHG